MKLSKKKFASLILLVAVLVSSIAYAGIITQWKVSHHLTILGGAIELWVWEEPERYSLPYESDDCGSLIGGESWKSRLLVLAVGANASAPQTLTFNTTLPKDVGYIVWQVEICVYIGPAYPNEFRWFDWTESEITVHGDKGTTINLPGTPTTPIEPLQKIGLRPPDAPKIGNLGHLRYTIYTYPNATCDNYDFDITVTGTEA